MRNLKPQLMDRLAEMSLAALPDDVIVTLISDAEKRAEEAVESYLAGLTPVRVGRAFAAGIALRKKQQATRAVKP